jgi:hypothetical protein
MFTQFDKQFSVDQNYLQEEGVTQEFVFDPNHHFSNNPSGT